MAFEYLLTHYLINLDLKKAVDRIAQMPSLGLTRLPRHYEEAWLLYQHLQRTRLEINGLQPGRETAQRFERFVSGMGQQVHRTPEGRARLLGEFGDTFWYYYLSSPRADALAAGKPPGTS